MSGANDRIFDGRYALDVQVASSLSSPIWRAMDLSLKRWVNLILLPTSDLRSVKLLQECQMAAANDRRDVVSILDVIPDGKISSANDSASQDRYVGIVTEWLDGETLDRLIVRRGEVLPIEQALRQLGTIANTLMHAHSLNVFHRRLRPHNVIFSPGQEVRLAGFGVDSALLGPDSNDGVAQDIKGVGQLLFVMITGMWPLGSVDSLPAALSDGGVGLVLPSQVHGGVRPFIDQLYKRTQDGTFTSMRQVLDALSVGEVEESESLQNRVSRLTASSVTWTPPQSAGSSKVRSTLIAGLSVLVFGWLGWQLLTSNFDRSDSDIAVLTSPLPSMEISQATGELAKITAVTIYDPLGDNEENSEQALLAIDGDKESAWTTVSYRQADMSGKAGVGLVLDLGSAQDVYAVEVDFTSIGHSAEIYVVNSAEPDFVTAPKFGDVDPAESSSSVAVSNPVSGRYVLIWLTPDLPKSDTNEYKGGLSEVRVRL
ncbi:MAG: Serine/threonine-protein kinase [Actinomycetota bacterium]